MAKTAPKIRFEATLLRPADAEGDDSWTFLRLPKEASDQLPSRSMTSVDGLLNGTPFLTTLRPDGEAGHWMKVGGELRRSAGAEVGTIVALVIWPVEQEPEPEVPEDIAAALAKAPAKAREVWVDITPIARRDWIQSIVTCKQAETRVKRIVKTIDMLSHGKRRPCCFDRSGIVGNKVSCPVADEP